MAELADLISPNAVAHRIKAADKREALASLAVIAADAYGVDPTITLEAALEREHLGGTGVGEGVAIPHARLREIATPKAVLAVFEPAIDFDAPDGRPADLVVLLLSPVDAGADHLKALARVSRSLRKPAVRDALRAARSAPALHVLLSRSDAVRAA